MSIVRPIVVLFFFLFAACGPSSPANTAQITSAGLSPCTDCADRRIASHGIVFTGMPENAKELLSLAASASHAGIIRMDLTWTMIQPDPSAPYDWHWVDESIAAAKKNNVDILALVAETPTWASSRPNSPAARSYPPAADHWDEWDAFITAFVERYGARGTNEIHYWEIWGEANDNGQWQGTPSEYAQLYSRAYDAIKRSDPAAQVLMAGLNESKMPDWLDAVLNDPAFPAKSKIDIIDVHIRGTVAHVQEHVGLWLEAFQKLGGVTGKPLWITEFGFPSDPKYQPTFDPDYVGVNPVDGEEKQADYYNAVIPLLMADERVTKLFVTLRDLDAPGTPWASEGIVTLEGKPKIAFETIKTLSDRFR